MNNSCDFITDKKIKPLFEQLDFFERDYKKFMAWNQRCGWCPKEIPMDEGRQFRYCSRCARHVKAYNAVIQRLRSKLKKDYPYTYEKYYKLQNSLTPDDLQ